MNRTLLNLFQIVLSGSIAMVVGFGALSAQAQTPSKAQQSAIRSACPSDYRSYCASVPPGGKPALDCLQQNVAKLSDACRTAVQAVGGSAAAPATTPPAATATTPPAGKAATTDAAKPAGAAPAPKAPGPAVAATPAPHLSPRDEAALVRRSCNRDFRTHCRGVPLGGGNVVACLKANAASLSPRCQSALAPFVH